MDCRQKGLSAGPESAGERWERWQFDAKLLATTNRRLAKVNLSTSNFVRCTREAMRTKGSVLIWILGFAFVFVVIYGNKASALNLEHPAEVGYSIDSKLIFVANPPHDVEPVGLIIHKPLVIHGGQMGRMGKRVESGLPRYQGFLFGASSLALVGTLSGQNIALLDVRHTDDLLNESWSSANIHDVKLSISKRALHDSEWNVLPTDGLCCVKVESPDDYPWTLRENQSLVRNRRLSADFFQGEDGNPDAEYPCEEQSDIRKILRRKQTTEITVRVTLGPIILGVGCFLLYYNRLTGWRGRLLDGLYLLMIGSGWGALCLPVYWQAECKNEQRDGFHNGINVSQKHLTHIYLCNTVIDMANVLPKDKQIAIIGALAEGSSIRSIERITGVHRDTIMRLGVRTGRGCELLMDSKMQDLGCRYLQMDEVWGFIGKKERHVSVDDDPTYGDVWTYCAIDAETKLVPAFKCGKRNLATTTEFVQDVASRMRNRVQISTDALRGYVEAIEQSFGADVDYGQIVKVYVHDDHQHPERKYSAPHFASAMRRPISGEPEIEMVSTSYIERLNATTRLHVKRLSRLTLAFSKKLENFQAAVALHFAYYNFVRRHNSLRCTPAMAAGVERDFWTVGDLVEATV